MFLLTKSFTCNNYSLIQVFWSNKFTCKILENDNALTVSFFRLSNVQNDYSPAENFSKPKRLWICTKCQIQFKFRKELTKHRSEIHLTKADENKYKYTYNALNNLFSCNTCDMEVDTLEGIEEHVNVHEEKYNCTKCDTSFTSPYKYSLHHQKHVGDGIYRCALCKYTTHRVSSMQQHVNMTHLKQFYHTCRYCGKGFGDRISYIEHENIHKGADPFICIVCQRKFPFSKYLHVHQKRHHTVTIDGVLLKNQCNICKKKYSKSSTLENHMLKHTKGIPKPKVHLCDNCGKGFATKGKLTEHYRVHTGDKPYTCRYCKKSFTKRDYLVLHERIHSGEKPYSCDFCGKCFNQDASYRIHVRMHTGERPYTCQLCKKGFISNTALKSHLKSCDG